MNVLGFGRGSSHLTAIPSKVSPNLYKMLKRETKIVDQCYGLYTNAEVHT